MTQLKSSRSQIWATTNISILLCTKNKTNQIVKLTLKDLLKVSLKLYKNKPKPTNSLRRTELWAPKRKKTTM